MASSCCWLLLALTGSLMRKYHLSVRFSSAGSSWAPLIAMIRGGGARGRRRGGGGIIQAAINSPTCIIVCALRCLRCAAARAAAA